MGIYKSNVPGYFNLGLAISTHIYRFDIMAVLCNAEETLPLNIIPILIIDLLPAFSFFICFEHIKDRY